MCLFFFYFCLASCSISWRRILEKWWRLLLLRQRITATVQYISLWRKLRRGTSIGIYLSTYINSEKNHFCSTHYSTCVSAGQFHSIIIANFEAVCAIPCLSGSHIYAVDAGEAILLLFRLISKCIFEDTYCYEDH